MNLGRNSLEIVLEGLDYLILELDNQIAVCPDRVIYEVLLTEYKDKLTRVKRLRTILLKQLNVKLQNRAIEK